MPQTRRILASFTKPNIERITSFFREDAVKRSLNSVDRSVETKGFGLKRNKIGEPFYSRVPWNIEATLFLRQKELYLSTERAMTLRMRIPVSICLINRAEWEEEASRGCN